jgi:UDP-N-acetylglucosamine--N-acetylmuramyl-(pentapeptide) pyrophosphoryl-undecaprenol N-acetylglucosamine transferase
VIYSTGGAVSVPTLVLGHYLSPVITHEQTAQVGLANKVASKYATTFAVGFEEAAVIARKLNKNVVVTGNPVRASLRQGEKSRGLAQFGFTSELPVLYVTGGARGASPLNDRIAALLPDLLAHTQILHQAGPKSANDDVTKLENLQRSWPEHLQKRYRVVPFVGAEMPDVYAMTDLVIARSGAGTVSELAFAGLPSVLIPLPGTWGDEQTKNAQVLAAAGAAVVLPQPEATPERLRTELVALLHDPDRRNRMAASALRIAQPNAAANLLDEILKLRK